MAKKNFGNPNSWVNQISKGDNIIDDNNLTLKQEDKKNEIVPEAKTELEQKKVIKTSQKKAKTTNTTKSIEAPIYKKQTFKIRIDLLNKLKLVKQVEGIEEYRVLEEAVLHFFKTKKKAYTGLSEAMDNFTQSYLNDSST